MSGVGNTDFDMRDPNWHPTLNLQRDGASEVQVGRYNFSLFLTTTKRLLLMVCMSYEGGALRWG